MNPVRRHHGFTRYQLALWGWHLRSRSTLGGSNRLEALPDSLGQLSLLQDLLGLS